LLAKKILEDKNYSSLLHFWSNLTKYRTIAWIYFTCSTNPLKEKHLHILNASKPPSSSSDFLLQILYREHQINHQLCTINLKVRVGFKEIHGEPLYSGKCDIKGGIQSHTANYLQLLYLYLHLQTAPWYSSTVCFIPSIWEMTYSSFLQQISLAILEL
jgi:hypothetical protein